MTTLMDLIERARAAAADRPTRDAFNATLAADGTQNITFLNGDKMAVAGIIDTQKFETMRILTKPTLTTGTVERAIFGTTQASFAVGDDIYIGFRFTYAAYRRAINNALASIATLFGNPQWDSSQAASTLQQVYAVPAAATRVLQVCYIPDRINKFKFLPFRFFSSVPAAAGVVAGPAVQLEGYNPGKGTLYIQYEKPWTTLTAGTDPLDTTFPSEGEDCIIFGALAYLENDEAFRRVAFDAPHGKQQVFSTATPEAEQAASLNLQRFLQRRAELAARYRRQNTTWMKDG